jgi:hypothetical protein
MGKLPGIIAALLILASVNAPGEAAAYGYGGHRHGGYYGGYSVGFYSGGPAYPYYYPPYAGGYPAYYVNPDPYGYVAAPPPQAYAPAAQPPAYQSADGQYCREYTRNIVVGGKQQKAYGNACMQPDGRWKIVD